MEHFYRWIRTIIFYMIFINFVTNLLPGKTYTRYIRLFMGMALILLVIRPLTGSLRLDEQLARRFEEISFQNEAGEFQGQLEEIERQRFEAIADEYERAVSVQAAERLEKNGYRDAEVRVSVDREQASSDFGTVKEMEVLIGKAESLEEEQEIRQVSIEKDHIQVYLGDREEDNRGEEKLKEQKNDGKEKAGNPGVEEEIRKELADFYGLEEHHIKIKIRD